MCRPVPWLAILTLACSNQGAPLQGIPGETGGSMTMGNQPDASVEVPDGSVDLDAGCAEAPRPPTTVPCLPDGGPSLSPVLFPAVNRNTVLQFSIFASCGSPPYSFLFLGGTLPTGVDAVPEPDQNAIVIAGQPADAQSCPYLFTVEAIDAEQRSTTVELSLQVNP
jgi:hypothetical protein